MGEHDQTLDKDAYRSIHDDGRKLPPIRREEYFHQYDDYANPIPGSEYLPTYAHQAFLFSRKELIPEIVYVHGDKFTSTEWEAQFSDLTGSGDEQSFVPVVDDNFRVVGHLGWIDGKNICVPKKTIAEGYGYPYAAELEKARLFGVHRRLVSIHYSIVDSRLPGFPGQPVSAAPTKRPAPCWPANKPPALSLPNPKDEEALWNSLLEAPGKDVSEEQRRLGNLNFFLAGGGNAIVGFKFGWNLVPREQWQVRQHLDYPIYSYPFDTYLMISGYRFQVLVAPDGHIQAVLGVEKYQFELPEEKVLRVAFKIIDIALTVWMIIDIFTIPVVLFRLGAMVAERAAIRAVKVVIDEEAKAVLKLAEQEAKRVLVRGAMTGPERAEAKTAWAKLKQEFWKAGDRPPSRRFSIDEAKEWNTKIEKRMSELGIPKKNQGAGVKRIPPPGEKPPPGGSKKLPAGDEHKAFNETGSTRGGNYRSSPADRYGGEDRGISVHGNVFDRWEGFKLWNDPTTTDWDRIDAIIAHEWSEFNGLTHWETAELVPETKLAISPRARQLSRQMMMMGGEPEMASMEFTKAEWNAIVAAGKATASFEEKMAAVEAAAAAEAASAAAKAR
jgi:hypothetical protein